MNNHFRIFKKLFCATISGNALSASSCHRRNNTGSGLQTKKLSIESLESRQMLAVVSLQVNVFEDVAGNASDVSLRYALTQASKNPSDEYHISFTSEVLEQGIVLSTPLTVKNACTVTIAGAGLTLSGDGNTRLFTVSTGANVTLENLTLKNGKANEGGTISVVNSTLTMEMVTVMDCTADKGAAVYATGSTVVLTSCDVSGNVANSNGGALYVTNKSVIIVENCDFSGNTASLGGAVYITGNSDLLFDGCNFVRNTANGNGGAVYTTGTSDLVFDECRFDANRAEVNGGAVYVQGPAPVTWNNCVFDANRTISGHGGAVYAGKNSNLTWQDDCTFVSNRAGGGAAVFAAANATLTVTDSRFSNNTAETRGGALRLELGANADIVNTVFVSNTATLGGAIHLLSGSRAVLEGCTIENNHARAEGGAAYVTGDGSALTVQSDGTKNSIIRGNTAIGNGGAFYLQGSATDVVLPHLVVNALPSIINQPDETFYNNLSSLRGGAIAADRAIVDLYNVFLGVDAPQGFGNFLPNSAGALPGNAIFATGVGMKITKHYFQGNQAHSTELSAWNLPQYGIYNEFRYTDEQYNDFK